MKNKNVLHLSSNYIHVKKGVGTKFDVLQFDNLIN